MKCKTRSCAEIGRGCDEHINETQIEIVILFFRGKHLRASGCVHAIHRRLV